MGKIQEKLKLPIILPPLPYAKDALSPHISAETIDYHYGKHHQAYLTKLNTLIEGSSYAELDLEEIILKSSQNKDTAIFNNAAQVWNHTFYWQCMAPRGGGRPSGAFLARLEAAFGSFDGFLSAFKEAALAQFGSGWAWLTESDGKLTILKTSNAESPLTTPGTRPLLTCDVWEHAYYIDYRNRRPDYVDTFLTHLINWPYVESRTHSA